MLDFFNLPKNIGSADVQVFNAGLPEYQTYTIPRGKTMLFIYAIGGGGGGGGGLTGAAASARGGGGGGSSSAMSTLLVPIKFLSEVLYVYCGNPGLGGSSGVNGTAGTGSYVLIKGALEATNRILYSGNNSVGGNAGTLTAGGTGGTSPGVATIANMPLAGLGLWQAFAGQAGTAGGDDTGVVGTAQAFPTNGINVMGGTGGGGTTSADFAGGLITGVSNSKISEGGPINAAAGSNNGSGGFKLNEPFFNYPGLGGGSSNTGVGGAGGHGSYGSGGGGGGGGTTGGRGGDGGSGLVVMIAW